MDASPDRNIPTIGTLLTAFVTALLSWGVTQIPDTMPTEVVTTGYLLVLAIVGVLIGKAAQNGLGILKEKAPWSSEMHQAAVIEAFSLDPEHDDYAEAKETLLAKIGVPNYRQALLDMGVPEEDIR